MEDIRIMRKTVVNEVHVAVVAAGILFIPENPNRVALVLSSTINTGVGYSFRPFADTGVGITIGSGQSPLTLDIQHHGRIVTQEIWATSLNNDDTVPYWETILEEE